VLFFLLSFLSLSTTAIPRDTRRFLTLRRLHRLQALMPPSNTMAGWPRRYYDDAGNIPCRARECGHIFRGDGWSHRKAHYERQSQLTLAAMTDHSILYQVHSQTQCASCVFAVPAGQLRTLFNHERDAHGTRNMVDIAGYVVSPVSSIFDASARIACPVGAEVLMTSLQRPYSFLVTTTDIMITTDT